MENQSNSYTSQEELVLCLLGEKQGITPVRPLMKKLGAPGWDSKACIPRQLHSQSHEADFSSICRSVPYYKESYQDPAWEYRSGGNNDAEGPIVAFLIVLMLFPLPLLAVVAVSYTGQRTLKTMHDLFTGHKPLRSLFRLTTAAGFCVLGTLTGFKFLGALSEYVGFRTLSLMTGFVGGAFGLPIGYAMGKWACQFVSWALTDQGLTNTNAHIPEGVLVKYYDVDGAHERLAKSMMRSLKARKHELQWFFDREKIRDVRRMMAAIRQGRLALVTIEIEEDFDQVEIVLLSKEQAKTPLYLRMQHNGDELNNVEVDGLQSATQSDHISAQPQGSSGFSQGFRGQAFFHYPSSDSVYPDFHYLRMQHNGDELNNVEVDGLQSATQPAYISAQPQGSSDFSEGCPSEAVLDYRPPAFNPASSNIAFHFKPSEEVHLPKPGEEVHVRGVAYYTNLS